MLSKFLPTGFDCNKPAVVIAGRDAYPLIMVRNMLKKNIPVRLIAFKDETLPELVEMFNEKDRAIIKVGQLGHMLKSMEKFEAASAVMAGQVTPGKLFRGMTPDLKAITVLATLKEKNAETIFGSIAREIEKINIQLMDARVFMDDELAEKKLMSSNKFKIEQEYLEHGIRIAKLCAGEDIGQGAVLSNGTVLAVEAFEGTDKMLERAGSFKAENTLFVKTVKQNQDYRFDVPVFGMRTLEKMREVGISAAALEADNVLILEKEKVLKAADKMGIPIMGY
jgi:UDP-2,3-diacylglucosamine hydrolase